MAQRFGILIHGGAGIAWPDEDPAAFLAGARGAAEAGYAVLARGGSALDAVEAAVLLMEDDPNFNAGTGSTLNRDGEVECDASVMDAASFRGGAVASVRTVKNPVRLARRVMEETKHLLLVGPGAEAFAREQKIHEIPNQVLVTARNKARWKAGPDAASSGGTVGAVACDAHGLLASATSTGGTFFKLPGRVGDTPILGAGTWAERGGAAVSCTGTGETMILTGLARWASDQIAHGRARLQVCQQAVAKLAPLGGHGGLIVIDGNGQPAYWFDTPRMPFAHRTSTTPLKVGLLPEDRETSGGLGA